MATMFYQWNYLRHALFQPVTVPETHYPAYLSVQIEVTIAVDLLINHHDCLTRIFTGSNMNFAQETLRFDLHLLEELVQAYEILGTMLTKLLILNPPSFTFDAIKDDIIRYGIIGSQELSRGRKVLHLRVDIWGKVEKHVNNERDLIRRVMEESALASNYGLFPAQESAAKKMLKRVRVEDGDECAKGGESNKKRKVKGEDCVICSEEITVVSDASEMPCSHIFHGACIEQWLKQSHYCPICRFEMPISESYRT